jgi:muramoyltetrapeptide carboxypeptidase
MNPSTRTLLKPERLCPGDTVGLVAPASAPPDPKAVDRAATALEKSGFKPKLAKNVRARLGFLAGTDRERATDLMTMFADKKVKAIVCLRGGYGSARILDRLDYEVIRRNPKILAGYSDITALHCALLQKAGLVSIHAPMWNGELADPKVPKFAQKSFFRTVMEAKPPGSIGEGYDGKSVSILRGGMAEGRLIGGNLSLLCASLGTPFAPAFKGKILFFEDISEKPYRLDRMLTQLLNAGIFSRVAGVAVGVNPDCNAPPAKPGGEYRQSGADVVKERLSQLRVPVVTGLPFGHVALNATIPVGVRARLDGNRGDLIITETAVR